MANPDAELNGKLRQKLKNNSTVPVLLKNVWFLY